jgi:hypothetical protein
MRCERIALPAELHPHDCACLGESPESASIYTGNGSACKGIFSWSQGKNDVKLRSGPDLVVDLDLSAMIGNDPVRYGKSESGAGNFSGEE